MLAKASTNATNAQKAFYKKNKKKDCKPTFFINVLMRHILRRL